MTASSLPESESLTVEFKTSFNEDVVQSLSAFANTKGGSVCVGVNDSRKAKSVTLAPETLKDELFTQIFKNIGLIERTRQTQQPPAEVSPTRREGMKGPVVAVTDAVIAGKPAGTTLMVLKHGKHPLSEIEACHLRLLHAGVKVKGVVFDNVGSSGAAYGSRYGTAAYRYSYGMKDRL